MGAVGRLMPVLPRRQSRSPREPRHTTVDPALPRDLGRENLGPVWSGQPPERGAGALRQRGAADRGESGTHRSKNQRQRARRRPGTVGWPTTNCTQPERPETHPCAPDRPRRPCRNPPLPSGHLLPAHHNFPRTGTTRTRYEADACFQGQEGRWRRRPAAAGRRLDLGAAGTGSGRTQPHRGKKTARAGNPGSGRRRTAPRRTSVAAVRRRLEAWARLQRASARPASLAARARRGWAVSAGQRGPLAVGGDIGKWLGRTAYRDFYLSCRRRQDGA